MKIDWRFFFAVLLATVADVCERQEPDDPGPAFLVRENPRHGYSMTGWAALPGWHGRPPQVARGRCGVGVDQGCVGVEGDVCPFRGFGGSAGSGTLLASALCPHRTPKGHPCNALHHVRLPPPRCPHDPPAKGSRPRLGQSHAAGWRSESPQSGQFRKPGSRPPQCPQADRKRLRSRKPHLTHVATPIVANMLLQWGQVISSVREATASSARRTRPKTPPTTSAAIRARPMIPLLTPRYSRATKWSP